MKDVENDPGPKPRYRWRETWPGEDKIDYAGWDGDRQFGRIRLETNGPTKGLWRWSIAHVDGVKRYLMPHNGYEKSARLAAAKVEDNYERLMEHNGIPLNNSPR